jgi:putative transposase
VARVCARPPTRQLAVDFFTVETLWLQRLDVLFFIELGSRCVHLAGCTPTPSAPWVIQRARQLTWALADRPEPIRFLIRDRDRNSPTDLTRCFGVTGSRSFARRFAPRKPRLTLHTARVRMRA